MFIFNGIGKYINQKLIVAKFIRSLFYIYKDKSEIEKRKHFEHNIEQNEEYKGIDDLKCIKFKF